MRNEYFSVFSLKTKSKIAFHRKRQGNPDVSVNKVLLEYLPRYGELVSLRQGGWGGEDGVDLD